MHIKDNKLYMTAQEAARTAAFAAWIARQVEAGIRRETVAARKRSKRKAKKS